MKSEYWHIPVMLDEVVSFAKKTKDNLTKQGSDQIVFLDATLGGAGHSYELFKLLGKNDRLIGVDQDVYALNAAKSKFNEFSKDKFNQISFVNANFGNLDKVLIEESVIGVDFVLMDLGLSSPQIDNLDRGFSFKHDCRLDMRMDPKHQQISAADIVNMYSEKELCDILFKNSEEKYSSKIAAKIVESREKNYISTSDQLVEIIKSAIPAPARRSGGHPAKRSFMALRIEVNKELAVLKKGLDSAIKWLKPGGMIVVISYHSLEDKIVKDTFKSMVDRCSCPKDFPICVCNKKPVLKLVTKKPLCPKLEEVQYNPRARSAKIRVVKKI